jgi:hypothetical protein
MGDGAAADEVELDGSRGDLRRGLLDAIGAQIRDVTHASGLRKIEEGHEPLFLRLRINGALTNSPTQGGQEQILALSRQGWPRRMNNPFRCFNSSPDIVRLVVMTHVRFPLSLRKVEDLRRASIGGRFGTTDLSPFCAERLKST